MGSKILKVIGISGAVIIAMLLLTMLMPPIKSLSDYAYNATAGKATAGNYTVYLAAQKSMPLWIFAVPVLVGGIGVWVVLKRKTER